MRTALLTAAFACAVATNAQAQPTYTVTDLGYLPGGLDTTAVSVNNQGHVVGMAADENARSVAFFFAGSLVPLGTLGGSASKANDINDSDRIVGWATTSSGAVHAFFYDAGSANPQMIDLHDRIGFGGPESRATAINNSGQIVGIATVPGGNRHAFLLTGNTVLDLHSIVSSGGLTSAATGITDNGLIVGSADDAQGNMIAFVYDLNTSGLTTLGTLGGAHSAGLAVNRAGSVVGLSDTSNGDSYAFQTQPGSTLASGTNLGAFGGTGGSAFGINAAGISVGVADDAAGGAHAFIYTTALGMRDLETMIAADSGWTLTYAADINDSGAVVGVGVHNGTTGSFLLLPATTQVAIDTMPAGLTINADGVSDIAPTTYQWDRNSLHQLSTTEPQQLTAGSRLMFSSWSDGGAITHTVSTPDSPVTFTATFKAQYLLTTAANPPAGGSITPGDWFDSGSSVNITATAAAGYAFAGFSGDLDGTENSASITIDAARSVTANFKRRTTTSLSSSPNPSTFGQSTTMTATVVSPSGTPVGSVSFFDGATNIGNQPLDGAGSASLTAALDAGIHTLTVSYSGTEVFLASTSDPVTQTVDAPAPSVTPPVCPAPQSITLAAPFDQATFVPITPAGVTDPDGDSLTYVATSIFQDEPLTGAFDATLNPIQIRKWRSADPRRPASQQTGRVYHIIYTATDPSGAFCTGQMNVCLPRTEGVCGNRGSLYNSKP